MVTYPDILYALGFFLAPKQDQDINSWEKNQIPNNNRSLFHDFHSKNPTKENENKKTIQLEAETDVKVKKPKITWKMRRPKHKKASVSVGEGRQTNERVTD